MPPSFIRRISRSSSGLVTAGPNHHQRIMMRASSGGLRKEDLRSSSGAAIDLEKPTENRMTTVARQLPQRLSLIVICIRIRYQGLVPWKFMFAAKTFAPQKE